MSHRRPAFTLIELLVVIAIIALLVAMILQASGPIRKSVERARCQTTLRGLSSAYLSYVGGLNRGCFPPIWAIGEYGVGGYVNWYYPQNCYQIMVAGRFDAAWGPLVWHGVVTDMDTFVCPTIMESGYAWWHNSPTSEQSFWTWQFANMDPQAARETYFKGSKPTGYTRASYNIRPYMHPYGRDQLAEQGVRAFLADNLSVPVCVQERHETGVNAAYLDGTAQWVEDEKLWNNSLNWDYLVKDPRMMELWKILDAAKE